MRGDEAKEHCPDIELVKVPSVRGKADLTKYRDAGKRVANVLQKYSSLLERASIDEAYLDITETVLARLHELNNGTFQLLPEKLINTFAVGYDTIVDYIQCMSSDNEDSFSQIENDMEENIMVYKKSDMRLLIGATIVNEIRAAVKNETGYDCSAGIAHNKILAKLTCGFNKPNKQTILSLKSITNLFSTLPICKVKGLGGKMGEILCEKLKVKFMGDLLNFSEGTLQKHLDEKNGSWLYLMARGVDLEIVTQRMASKSIGCCKRFPGRNSITGIESLIHWLNELAGEIYERLEQDIVENNRTAKQMTVSYSQQIGSEDISSTRSVPLFAYETERIVKDALETIKKNTDQFLKSDNGVLLNNPIKFLGISVGKFENNHEPNKANQLQELFSNITRKNLENSNVVNPPSIPVKPVVIEVDEQKNKIKSFFQNHSKREANNDESNGTQTQLLESTIVSDAEAVELEDVEPTFKKKIPQNSFFKNLFEKKLQVKNVLTINSEEPSLPDTEIKLDETASETDTNKVIQNDKSSNDGDIMVKNSFFRNMLMKREDVKLDGDEIQTNQCEIEEDMFPDEAEDVEGKQAKPPCRLIDEKPTCSKYVDHTSKSFKVKEDYKETYAEFYPFNEYEKVYSICSKCNKKVPEDEMVSHMDFHLAFELSVQQRQEYRKEIKLKINSPSAINPKVGNVTTKNKTKPITNFLLKNTVNEVPVIASATANDTDETIKCIECDRNIRSNDIAEHQDYHAAKKLHLEINNNNIKPVCQTSHNSGIIVAVNQTAGSGKRKRPASSAKEKSNPNKMKSVATYFKT